MEKRVRNSVTPPARFRIARAPLFRSVRREALYDTSRGRPEPFPCEVNILRIRLKSNVAPRTFHLCSGFWQAPAAANSGPQVLYTESAIRYRGRAIDLCSNFASLYSDYKSSVCGAGSESQKFSIESRICSE